MVQCLTSIQEAACKPLQAASLHANLLLVQHAHHSPRLDKLLNVSLAWLFVGQTVGGSHTIDLATIKYCNATLQIHSLKPKLKCLKTQRIHL